MSWAAAAVSSRKFADLRARERMSKTARDDLKRYRARFRERAHALARKLLKSPEWARLEALSCLYGLHLELHQPLYILMLPTNGYLSLEGEEPKYAKRMRRLFSAEVWGGVDFNWEYKDEHDPEYLKPAAEMPPRATKLVNQVIDAVWRLRDDDRVYFWE